MTDYSDLYSKTYAHAFQSGKYRWPESHNEALAAVADTARGELLRELDITENRHKIKVDGTFFTLLHSLEERLNGTIMDCDMHGLIEAQAGPPASGNYWLYQNGLDGSPVLERIEE